MADTIIVAIITGVVTLAGVLISNGQSDAIQNERIENLREEVKKHNQLVERVYHLEGTADRHEDELKRLGKRLENGGL